MRREFIFVPCWLKSRPQNYQGSLFFSLSLLLKLYSLFVYRETKFVFSWKVTNKKKQRIYKGENLWKKTLQKHFKNWNGSNEKKKNLHDRTKLILNFHVQTCQYLFCFQQDIYCFFQNRISVAFKNDWSTSKKLQQKNIFWLFMCLF